MAFRLVSSGGAVTDPAFVGLSASGTIHPGDCVDFIRASTGTVIGPSTSASTTTMVFGVANGYTQAISDTNIPTILFNPGQLWEVDCANAGLTAQVGLRHALGSGPGVIHNTSTDVSISTGVFLALALVGSTSGSAKLLGKFYSYAGQIVPVNATTFLQ